MDKHERDGLLILLGHGVADGATTALAYAALGASGEANPLIRMLLQEGVGFAIGAMLLVVGGVAIAYPKLAEFGRFPRWFGPMVAAVGFAVALLNLAVVYL